VIDLINRRFPLIGLLAVVVLLALAPVLLSPFRLGLLAKYLCFAIVGVGICLAWGHGGMLTLGQGVFFGLGGYAMGMYLKLHEVGPGGLPDFMVWSGVEELPVLWRPFANPVFALLMVIVLPSVVAAVLGLLVFRRRVRGAYFAILSQALAIAFSILLVGQQALTGGTNGLTNFVEFFGMPLHAPDTQRSLYLIAATALGVVYLVARLVVRSRFGQLLLAVRDAEDRVRFLGYDPATIKTITFTISAVMAGIGGALFVPIAGIISPTELGAVASIGMLIGVAVGGRFSLPGAIGGAILVNYLNSFFSETYPAGWLYLQGTLFILVIAVAPKGLAGLRRSGWELLTSRLQRRSRPTPPAGPASPTPAQPPGAVPAKEGAHE
jgi:urea transport system permease protein